MLATDFNSMILLQLFTLNNVSEVVCSRVYSKRLIKCTKTYGILNVDWMHFSLEHPHCVIEDKSEWIYAFVDKFQLAIDFRESISRCWFQQCLNKMWWKLSTAACLFKTEKLMVLIYTVMNKLGIWRTIILNLLWVIYWQLKLNQSFKKVWCVVEFHKIGICFWSSSINKWEHVRVFKFLAL